MKKPPDTSSERSGTRGFDIFKIASQAKLLRGHAIFTLKLTPTFEHSSSPRSNLFEG